MKRLPLIGITLLAGCLFSTRTPQPPDASATFLWTPATTPDYLIQNLTGALKILDAPDYKRVFISPTEAASNGTMTFSFTPSPNISQSSKEIFTPSNWSVMNEGAWVTALAGQSPPNSQITLQLTDTVIDQSANTASFSYNYALSTPASTSSNVIPGIVQGSLQFQLAFVTTDEGTKEWRIVSWTDGLPPSGNGPTWSDLKVDLSS